jgi:hypothetical protein
MPSPSALVLAALLTLIAAAPAAATMAEQRIGGCPERIVLAGDGERRVAAVLSLVPDRVTLAGNPERAAVLRECARTVRAVVCTDGLLLSMLDPVGATAGGVAGLAVDGVRGQPSLLGGLLGAGVGGMAVGVVGMGRCNKRLNEELAPAAAAAFAGWRVDPGTTGAAEVRGRIVAAYERGAVSAAAARSLDSYLDGIATRLAQP